MAQKWKNVYNQAWEVNFTNLKMVGIVKLLQSPHPSVRIGVKPAGARYSSFEIYVLRGPRRQ